MIFTQQALEVTQFTNKYVDKITFVYTFHVAGYTFQVGFQTKLIPGYAVLSLKLQIPRGSQLETCNMKRATFRTYEPYMAIPVGGDPAKCVASCEGGFYRSV